MNKLWTYIDNMKWNEAKKYRMVLFITGTLFALAGFALWLVVRNWCLSSWSWALCFTGYPIFASWLTIFLYSCNHDFHDGSSQ